MMNIREKEDKFVDAILREAYEQVKPADSWESLRTRIDESLRGLCFLAAGYGTKMARSLTAESGLRKGFDDE